jgi:DNA replication protein DnaC
MNKDFIDARFSDFEVTENNRNNLKLCNQYCSKFSKMCEDNHGLLFWGKVGTGKSYAAACIANELLAKGIPVIMTSFVKLLEIIQQGPDRENDLISRLNSVKLVIFDDLGTERNTDYALEKVYNIVDSRYRAKLPMILTTNLTVNDMMSETDIRYKRIYDRIFEVCYPMEFTGPSGKQPGKQAKEEIRE